MRLRRLHWLALLLVALLTYTASTTARPVAALQAPKPIAESGFKPSEHGFSFQNYGNENRRVIRAFLRARRAD